MTFGHIITVAACHCLIKLDVADAQLLVVRLVAFEVDLPGERGRRHSSVCCTGSVKVEV